MTWNQQPAQYWPTDAAAVQQPGAQAATQAPAGFSTPAVSATASGAGGTQQPDAGGQDPGTRAEQAAVPAIDVVETPSDVVVTVDVPGFEKDELAIHADGNHLYVSGDRSADAGVDADEGEQALVTERPVRVERAIPVPVRIDPEAVTATHENGVCEVVVPKDDTERRHEIGFQ